MTSFPFLYREGKNWKEQSLSYLKTRARVSLAVQWLRLYAFWSLVGEVQHAAKKEKKKTRKKKKKKKNRAGGKELNFPGEEEW